MTNHNARLGVACCTKNEALPNPYDTGAQCAVTRPFPCKQIGLRTRETGKPVREFVLQLRAVRRQHERIRIMPGFLWIRVDGSSVRRRPPEPAFNLLLVRKPNCS